MKRRTTTILFSLALLLGTALWLRGPHLRNVQAAGNAWTTKTPMPTGRGELAAAEIDGKLYVVGGRIADGELNKLEVYDPATDTWTTKAPMPWGRVGLAAAALNGKLYVVGGSAFFGGNLTNLMVYDPATDQWTTKQPLSPRLGLAAAAINGKLYVIGGGDSSGFLDKLEVYDPVTDQWTTKQSMSTRRYFPAAAALNGKLYVVGGRNNSGFLDKLEVYDPVTDQWTTKQSMSTGRLGLAAAALNGKLYAIGGNTSNRLEVYDPATDQWATKQSMSTARLALAAAAINGKLYAVGGENGNNYLNTLEVYSPPEPNAWASKTAMPTVRHYLAAAELNGQLYVVGGTNGGNLNTLEAYDPATDQWTTKTPMPTARQSPAAVAIHGKLYVVGGNNGSSYLNTLEVYDPATNSWQIKAPMPATRRFAAAAEINGQLYVVGGDTDNSGDFNRLDVYDPATNQWLRKADMPEGRFGMAAAAINGQLYVVTGTIHTNLTFNKLEIYDPATNLWTGQTGMPTKRSSVAAVALNGQLYVVGGNTATGSSNALEVYHPASGQWAKKVSMPTARYSPAATALNGKLFVVGGYTDITSTNALEDFQVASDLTLAKSHLGNFTSGTDGSYTLTVSNAADANCTEGPIIVTDTLPNGLSYAAVNGAGWSCTATGQTVTCINASLTLDAGDSSSFTLSVHATSPGTVTNHADVATTDEIVTNNNSANNGNGDLTTIDCPVITTMLSGATMICSGGTATLSVDVQGGTAPYIVKLSDGQQKTSSTLPLTFTVSPTTTTTYTVQTLLGNYACGLTTSNSVTVTVNTLPTLSYLANYSTVYGNAITINPTSGPNDDVGVTGIALQNVAPNNPGGISVNDAGVVSVASTVPANNYTVTIRISDACGNKDVSFLLNVQKAPLGVTAHNAFRNQGAANPPLSGSITGLKNGDNITASYSTTTTFGSAPGNYPITATLNDPNNRLGNYQVTNTPGTLKVFNSCGIGPVPFFATQGAVGGYWLYYQPLSASPPGLYTFSLFAGTLPPGLSIVNNFGQYTLQGAPTTRGTYTFTLLAKNTANTCEAIHTYTITIW